MTESNLIFIFAKHVIAAANSVARLVLQMFGAANIFYIQGRANSQISIAAMALLLQAELAELKRSLYRLPIHESRSS